MVKKLSLKIVSLFDLLKFALMQFKSQSPYEVRGIIPCQKTGKHIVELKITGKGQSISYSAEEIIADSKFIMCLSPQDVRTITYHATCDRYEKILREERINKSYMIIRSKSIKGAKSIQLRHKETNERTVIPLKDFSDKNLIDKLDSQDAYYLGYLAGQEQTWKDCVRLKLLSCNEHILPNE